jgi:hypothetical protein
MNGKKCGRKLSWAILRYFLCIWLERLRIDIKYFGQDVFLQSRESVPNNEQRSVGRENNV